MFMQFENHVKTAVTKLGGPTKTSNLLGLSNGAVHAWIRKGRIADIDIAKRVCKLSGMTLEQVRSV